jgi:hypothetical protein
MHTAVVCVLEDDDLQETCLYFYYVNFFFVYCISYY